MQAPGQVQRGSGEGSGEGLGLWFMRRVRFNRVPEKVPEKVWESLVRSQVRFNRVSEKVLEKVPEKVLEKVWEALVQSQVRFNSVPEKVPQKVPEGLGDFGAEPHQVQQGSREGSGGGFGAEPGRDQQGFGKGSEEGLGDFGADPGSRGFRRRYRKALVQSRATETIHSYPKDTVFSRRDVFQDNAVVCIKRCRTSISSSNTSEKYQT